MSLLPAIFLIAIPALFGTASFAALGLFKEKVTLLLTGTTAGLSLVTFLAYFTTPFFPLSNTSLLVVMLAAITATAALLLKTPAWPHWRSCRLDKTTLVVLIFFSALSVLISPKLLINLPDGSLVTGVANAYGDIGWHLSNITTLQYNNSFVPDDPILAGTPLAYPFLTNFFSAMLLAAGASFTQSVGLPTLILFPLTFTLLYRLIARISKSKLVALIFLLLFLFSGSPAGWVQFFGDWQESSQTLSDFIFHLPQHYTGHSDNLLRLHIINPIISLLLPQRTFLFGIPLAATILLLLLKIKDRGVPALITAGVLAGLLPLFHAHTVLALIPVIVGLVIIHPTKKWLSFFATAGLVGIPGLLIYQAGSSSFSSLFKLQLGWMSGPDNFFIYWIKNSGLLIPATLLALFLPAPRALKLLACAGLVLFIASNIWLFSTWEWDNTKLFVYWLIFTLPAVSYLLASALRVPSLIIRAAAIAFLIFHSVSGVLDVWQLIPPHSATSQVWSSGDTAFARQIRATTKPDDVILTAPIHNSAVALTGRSQYLGYPGHVWTHGGNFWQREQAIKQFYAGQIERLPETSPAHVLIGPAEKYMYPSLKIQLDWRLVARQNEYSLYKLP